MRPGGHTSPAPLTRSQLAPGCTFLRLLAGPPTHGTDVSDSLLLLALEDFLPVLASAAGLWLLARLSSRLDKPAGRSVGAGGALVVVGGLTKPVYKLTLALSDGAVDITVLDRALFWLLAPGFVILTFGLRRAARVEKGAPPTGLTPAPALAAIVVAVAAVLALSGSEASYITLLVATTLANVWAVVVLVRWSTDRSDRIAAVLFTASLLVAFGLAATAASLEQTIAVQWGEQLASTAGQALFWWGSLRLWRATGLGAQP